MNRFYPVHRLAQPRIPRAWSRACRPTLSSYLQRRLVSSSAQDVENTNVAHSRFLAEAESTAKWKDAGKKDPSSVNAAHEDFDTIEDGKGKLSPTSSHLFKLILPLHNLFPYTKQKDRPPIVILLHPSQPLSHASRLLLSALPAKMRQHPPDITFRSTSAFGQQFEWSDSTDVGDFIRDASQSAQFSICVAPPDNGEEAPKEQEHDEEDKSSNSAEDDGVKHPIKHGKPGETVIEVTVPTFADRTQYLRRKLDIITRRLKRMDVLKEECDHDAHRGAKRMAVGGLGMLVVYWGAVARLTFWDYGWDIMEPITYLSGLSTVILGYLWFLYQGRDVSYSSVLNRSVSARREALYKQRGLDIDRWLDLIAEAKSIKKEISRIAEDYEDSDKDKNQDGEDDDKAEERARTRKEENLPEPDPTEGEKEEKKKDSSKH